MSKRERLEFRDDGYRKIAVPSDAKMALIRLQDSRGVSYREIAWPPDTEAASNKTAIVVLSMERILNELRRSAERRQDSFIISLDR